MKIIIAILTIIYSGGAIAQEFDLTPDQTVIRDDITRTDIESIKPGMTMREVISVLGYPEATAVQLPFMSYKASDRNDGYRYIFYLSNQEEGKELLDLRIIAAVTAKSPWTYSEPFEIIWETKEWRENKEQKDANQAFQATETQRPLLDYPSLEMNPNSLQTINPVSVA